MAGDESRQDRELIELLNELRVALPGVQVLFAFLLTVPFSQGFAKVTLVQQKVYFTAFLCAATATVFLMAPTTYHRIQWRARDKERMLRTSNWFALVGMVFLALSIVCVVFVITDFLFGGWLTPVATAASAGVYAGLWFVLPLTRRVR
jgi:hypothetical protein